MHSYRHLLKKWHECWKDCIDCKSLVWPKVSRNSFLNPSLLDAQNPWGISLVGLTWVYGLNQKSDQKMGYSISCTYCVWWITFFVSITVQILCYSSYINPFHFCWVFGNPDIYLGAKLCKTRLHNEVWAWAMSPVKYV